ncbi:MAG: SDR family oxidoreductase, partial [Kiritimatiellaeota bacterium]|nr:SDR family oxidoreductase [Kiritimatiellota bacterium]
ARELSALGVRAEARGADIADPAQVKTLIEQVAADLGGLHLLVNNAGVLDDGLISFMKDDQWRRVLAVNLDGPFFAMRAAAMLMARQRFGRIVNIASDAGRLGAANRSNYAAAKEGLVGLTRSAARELAGLGIRVNAVSPGFVETAMTEGLTDARRKELLRAIPVRRLGRPTEVAEAVLFLCLPQADYITGQVLFVDGGMFMG